LRKRTILAVFLIMILFLAGCDVSRETSVNDRPIQTKSMVNEPTANKQKPASDKVVEPIQPFGKDLGESPIDEPTSEATVASKSNPGGKAKARLLATRDYGETTIFNQWVPVQEKQDALSLTAKYLDVKTSYGGSFINAINGLESGYTGKMALKRQKYDWFFYFNGVLAGSGAGDVKVKPGDVVCWDYHDWGSAAFTPAIIGAFPHPFTNGVTLAYSPSAQDAAGRLAASLGQQGIKQVQLQEANNEVINKRQRPVILLGLREEIMALPAMQALNSNPQRTGLFCGFSDSGFRLLDVAMQEGRTVKGGDSACIEATASGMGDANPLWLVIAENEKGLQRAVNYLSEGSINPDCAWGVLLETQGLTPLPLP
jgi:hypothetical protein